MDEHIWMREGCVPKVDEHSMDEREFLDEGGMCPFQPTYQKSGRVLSITSNIDL